MRIGVDAKWFFGGNPSGRMVIRNYLEQLIQRFPDHEYFVFLKNEDRNREFPWQGPGIHLIYCWGRNNLISNLLVIPWKARKLNLDVALFQYFAPFCSPFKTVVFIHDVIFKSHPEFFTFWERLYFRPMKFTAHRADRVIAVSQSEKKRIVGFRIAPESRVEVIYHGLNSNFRPREFQDRNMIHEVVSRFHLPERFLLYVGRLNERKNIFNLLQAVKFSRDPEIKLVLAGMPQGRMFDLEKKIRELGLANRVIATGHVPDEYLPALYSLATVFCFVSHDEGFGFPPLEAMASDVPVVLSEAAALREVCGDAGSYADPNRPEEIAGQIDALLENRSLYKEKTRSGRERVRRYQWPNSVDRLMEILVRLHAGV